MEMHCPSLALKRLSIIGVFLLVRQEDVDVGPVHVIAARGGQTTHSLLTRSSLVLHTAPQHGAASRACSWKTSQFSQ